MASCLILGDLRLRANSDGGQPVQCTVSATTKRYRAAAVMCGEFYVEIILPRIAPRAPFLPKQQATATDARFPPSCASGGTSIGLFGR